MSSRPGTCSLARASSSEAGAAIDIHDLKQAQEALQVALKTKNDFVGFVSHELRAPRPRPGVSSSDQAFELFFRSEPNEPGVPGVGLGPRSSATWWSAWAAILAPSRETEGPMRALRSRQ
jgi:hypothetical protein